MDNRNAATTTTATLAELARDIESLLRRGWTAQAVVASYPPGLVEYDEETDSVVLPGYWQCADAQDGARIVATTREEAAQAFAAGYPTDERTRWYHVAVYPVGLRSDAPPPVGDGWIRRPSTVIVSEIVISDLGSDHTITRHPPEPRCRSGADHRWRRIHLEGRDGGVLEVYDCECCEVQMRRNTSATDPQTGERGLEEIAYV